jgi:hypothetical protein
VRDVGVSPTRSSDGLNSVLRVAVVVPVPPAVLVPFVVLVVVWPFLVVVVMTLPPWTTVVTCVPSLRSLVPEVGAAGFTVATGAAAADGAAPPVPLLSRAVGGGGAELHAVTAERPAIARSAYRPRRRPIRREAGMGMDPPGCSGVAGRL